MLGRDKLSRKLLRVAKQLEAQETLLEEIQTIRVRYNRILESSFEEIYIFDAKSLLFVEVSKGTIQNLGYSLEEILTLTPVDIKPLMSKSQFDNLIQPLRDGSKEIVKFETLHSRKDGSLYDVAIRLQHAPGDEPVFIAMVTDITERKRYEEDLKTLAFKDAGSGLYNRRFFLEELEVSVSKSKRDGAPIGLILIDLDDFSKINNNHGHLVGDALILDIAKRIKSVFSRGGDIVARYGGDEFVVMCHNIDLPALTNKCQELVSILHEDFAYQGFTVKTSASIGMCYSSCTDYIVANDFIQEADVAMYEAKASGKDTFKVCKSCIGSAKFKKT